MHSIILTNLFFLRLVMFLAPQFARFDIQTHGGRCPPWETFVWAPMVQVFNMWMHYSSQCWTEAVDINTAIED
ncbi:hypothetical protein JTB14_013899 [Gonioctena quinquepunctata]|nr:hypothetical protein JTB14_013899 [Gonioctena quinquepunctata]